MAVFERKSGRSLIGRSVRCRAVVMKVEIRLAGSYLYLLLGSQIPVTCLTSFKSVDSIRLGKNFFIMIELANSTLLH